MTKLEMKTPAALARETGAEDNSLASEKPYALGNAIATLKLEQSLTLRPKGWYRITVDGDWTRITIYRPGKPEEAILCLSPGHANRVRQQLSDEGMAGLIEGAA